MSQILVGRAVNNGSRHKCGRRWETDALETDYNHNEGITVYRFQSKATSSWDLEMAEKGCMRS